jgi:glutamate transport system permease protein
MSRRTSLLERMTTPPPPRPGELNLVEELGPRGRRRAALATFVFLAVLVAAAAWAVWRFQIRGQFEAELWRPFRQWAIWRFLLEGLANTLKAALVAELLALTIGVLMAMWRTRPTPAARWLSTVYVEGFRACALVLLISFWFFQLPRLVDGWSIFRYAFAAVVIGLTLYYSTVFAEVVRSALNSLPRGQSEAALSIGLTPARAQRLVLLPQALRRALPNLITQSASLLKDTSLGALIVYPELLKQASIVGEFGSNQLQTFIVAGVMYVATIALVTSVALRLAYRTRRA